MQITSVLLLLLSLVPSSQASNFDYTPSTRYWKGADHWGDDLSCNDGEVMVGACSSTEDVLCRVWILASNRKESVSHAIECEPLERIVGGIDRTGWESSTRSGDGGVSCDSFSTGMCAGGMHSKCNNPDSKEGARTRLFCAEPSSGSSISVQTDQSIQCGGVGVQVHCPYGQAIQQACTSGAGSQCAGSYYGCKSGTFTALKCSALTISPTCTGESKEILSEVHESYNDTDATISVLSNASNTWTELVDFSTNKGNNAVYRSACDDIVDSMYVEFTYKLTCNAGDITLDVFVAQHPRCISVLCTDSDYDELLKEDVVQLTVERNDNGWDCTGEFIEDMPAACSFQSDILSRDTDVIFARNSMAEPSIEQKKFLAGTISDAMVVTYDYTDESISPFVSACMEGGGLVEFASTVITCGNGGYDDASTESVKYHVTNYPACFGEACVLDDLSASGLAIASQFQETMVELDQMEPSVKCSVTADLSMGPQDQASFLEKHGLWIGIVGGLVLVCIGIMVLQSRGWDNK